LAVLYLFFIPIDTALNRFLAVSRLSDWTLTDTEYGASRTMHDHWLLTWCCHDDRSRLSAWVSRTVWISQTHCTNWTVWRQGSGTPPYDV